MDLQISYTSTGSLSLNFPLTAAVHLTFPCALMEHLNCPSLSSDTPSPRMTPSGCSPLLLERAGKGSAASCTVTTPSAQSVMWDIFQSNCCALETAEHPPACRAQYNPSAPFDIPGLPFARHIPLHLCTCQILCDSCSSQVQQGCEFPSDITVLLVFWWSPASVALAGFDKWREWCEEESRCFALFSSKQWCYFYRMAWQESKILPNLRALTCSSCSVCLSL